jgi:hypothetical protein
MRRSIFVSLPLLALIMAICVSVAYGQTVTGSITGEVTDPSGASLPGASVLAHNIDTGVDTPTTSNSSGLFRIQFLPIGHYEITVKADGFAAATLPAFNLEVLQTANFDVKMQMGNTSTTVNVSAAAPILNTENPTLGTTFTSNTIANLPLNGLDFSAVTLYMPGTVSTAGTSGPTSIERSLNFNDTPNMNGNRAQANNYTLDGIDINESFNNLISYSPAPESLQEIKVLTANSPAEYGNVNGGGVVSILKSGTNQFHGSAYGYVQDYRLNANSWTNNQASPIIPVNPYSQAQFGGSLGGPIKKDRLFFFVDYLGSRYHKGGITTANVFTPAMRNGDFSVLLSQTTPIQLYDSENGFTPYANNQGVPILNPVAKFLFANPKLYPLPNATPTDGIAANNYEGHTRSYKANNQGDIKIEYDPRGADKITGFYSMSTAYDGATALLPVSFPGVSIYPTKIMGANWVHTFSPALINSGRLGFSRTIWNQGLPTDPSGQFGTNGNAKVGIPFPSQSFEGFSAQNITGLSGVGTSAFNGGLTDNTYSYIDNLTWQHGRHLWSFGAQAVRYHNNYPTSNNYGFLGQLGYNGSFTTNPAAPDGLGYGGADFVLDRVNSAQATLNSVKVGQRQWRVAGFAQDDYKATAKLTVNIGVRYEVDQPWVESNNKTGNIDEKTGQVIYADHVPDGAPAGSGVCKNRGCYNTNYRQIMPRLGFAYQGNDRFVVRGGYGATSFYEGNSSNQRLTSITPFIQAVNITTLSPTAGNGGTPRTAEQGFNGGSTQLTGTFNVYPQDIQPAYVQEWNLTAEYAMTRTTSLQVGYIGEQGQHIEDYGNLNQYKVNGDPTSAPYYNNQYLGVNGIDASLGIGNGSLLVTESRAMMNFNALEAVLRQRLSHGLEYSLNYTYGKALTNSLGNYGLNVNGFSGAFQDYYNSAADYGPAGYDVTHNLSGTAVYALPVGRGKQYFSGANRIVDEAVGGWKIAGAWVAYSGFPETITGPGNNSTSFGNSRVNQYRKLKVVHRSLGKEVNGVFQGSWYGTDPSATPCLTAGVDDGVCAFGVPASNTFGTSRNGALRGPGYFNADMSAFKDFQITERHAVGFRFDAFNAFNIVSYGNPDTGISNGSFGQVASTGQIRSTERHLQFSAHYTF